MLEFLIGYWWLIIAGMAAGAVITMMVYKFMKKPSSEQLKKVKEWLLYAVMEAEKELGSGTGQMKLRHVYDKFLTKFPVISSLISFETFNALVDEALEHFAEMLKNENIKNYVEL